MYLLEDIDTILRDLAEAAATTGDTQEGRIYLTGALADAAADMTCLQSHRLSRSPNRRTHVSLDTLFLCVCSANRIVWHGQTPVEVKPSAWLIASQQYHAAMDLRDSGSTFA